MGTRSLELLITAEELAPLLQQVCRQRGLHVLAHYWPPHSAEIVQAGLLDQILASAGHNHVRLLFRKQPFEGLALKEYYQDTCRHSIVLVDAPRITGSELTSTWIAACTSYFDLDEKIDIRTPDSVEVFKWLVSPIRYLLKRPTYYEHTDKVNRYMTYTEGVRKWAESGGRLRASSQNNLYYSLDPETR